MKQFFLLLLGIAGGVGLGLLIGWWLWPVTYTNTSPANLRADYRDEYIRLIASAYAVDGDLGRAEDQLAQLNPEEPNVPLVTLAESLIERGAPSSVIIPLVQLARDLGTVTVVMEPYVQGGHP